jgi:hypothetical protein
MRFPVRLLRDRWPTPLERGAGRFFWSDPRVILDDRVTPGEFRTAMDAIQAGETVKITAANRHPAADALLTDYVDDFAELTIVDIGASDGSTSVDLIRALPAFKAYVIADLFLTVDVVTVGRRQLFFDGRGECVLLCGPRTLAWPSRSPLIHRMYSRVIDRGAQSRDRQTVLLLNPETRALLADDPRVTYAIHDVFTPWPGPAPAVIKVANLLGPYFDDDRIAVAARALLSSLGEGGLLLIVDNGTITGATPRGGLYRRSDDRFTLVAQTDDAPVIDQIIRDAREPAPRT